MQPIGRDKRLVEDKEVGHVLLVGLQLAEGVSHADLCRGGVVLIIDADLRKPTLHEVFRINAASGLTEGLDPSAQTKLVVRQVSANLSVLPGGRPTSDPMAALTSAATVRQWFSAAPAETRSDMRCNAKAEFERVMANLRNKVAENKPMTRA